MKKNRKDGLIYRAFREVRSNIKYMDKLLLVLVLLFAGFGLVMVFSASNITAVLSYHQAPTYFLARQLGFTILGLLAMIAFAIFIPRRWYPTITIVGLVGIFIIFIFMRAMTAINDAQSWYTVGTSSFQPSEFAKTLVILLLAWWYSTYATNKDFFILLKPMFKKYFRWATLAVPLVICMILSFMIAREPDFGTAGVLCLIVMLIFFALPSKNSLFKFAKIGVVLAGIAGIIGIYILQPHFISRENTSRQESRFAFTEPCSRSLAKTGYQVCNAYIAINNGGLWGRGIGQSTQKFLYLPEAFTDFVFPVVVEEIGLIGSSVVLVCYIILLTKILIIARNAVDLYDSLIAFGTFSYILIHIVINLGGVLALIPMTGIPLPFLSYGGSFLLNLFVLLGLTMKVSANIKKKGY
jgi:cell division protein FtsW